MTTAALTCCLPLEGGFGLPFTIEGQPPKEGPYNGEAGWISISPRYFDVFRIPIDKGRVFSDRDNGAGPRAVIVNEEFAKKFFSKDNALGSRITIGKGVGPEFDEPPRRNRRDRRGCPPRLAGSVAGSNDVCAYSSGGSITGLSRSTIESAQQNGRTGRDCNRFR